MKDKSSLLIFLTAFSLTLMSGHQRAHAQDALTSVKVNVQNISISSDRKTISYDVFIQDVDSSSTVAVPAFLFRLAVPKADIGSNGKTVTVTNTTTKLGATGIKISSSASGTDWIMKFTNSVFVTTYEDALVLSDTFPGTRIGTFNIRNTDESSFSNPLSFHATFPGTTPTVKNTVALFQPDTTALASGSTTALPSSLVTGTGTFSLSSSGPQLSISDPTVKLSKTYDSTTTATVIPGTLSGVLDSDKGNVFVSATAVYDDANVGTGKTITISYVLNGPASGNYTAPPDFTVKTGEITRLFTVKAYLEGLWNSSTKSLNKCKEWDNERQDLAEKYAKDVADLVTVELHSATYSNIAYTFSNLQLHQNGTITSDGSSSIELPGSVAGSFYVTIKNKNHLETTSASLVSFDGNTIDYDFTNDHSKAFVSDGAFYPTKQIDGKWMIYAGDLISDTGYPEINMTDLYELFNHRSSITNVYGYSTLDLNGDGFTDESDVYMLFPNKNIYLYKE